MGSSVILANGAQACNVFWKVGSSATLNTSSVFVGTILALTSITVQHAATITGRALARNGAVTLDDDTINVPSCACLVPVPDRHQPDPVPDRHQAGTVAYWHRPLDPPSADADRHHPETQTQAQASACSQAHPYHLPGDRLRIPPSRREGARRDGGSARRGGFWRAALCVSRGALLR